MIEESEDEGLLERYLGGEQIDIETISATCALAIATARFFPIMPTHAPAGVGIEGLFELFEQGFPSPVGAAMPTVYTPGGGDFGAVSCDPDGPLVAEVVRTTSDPFVGRLSLVRVFSGTLRPDKPLHISGHLQQFAEPPRRRACRPRQRRRAIGPLSAPLGDETRPVACRDRR